MKRKINIAKIVMTSSVLSITQIAFLLGLSVYIIVISITDQVTLTYEAILIIALLPLSLYNAFISLRTKNLLKITGDENSAITENFIRLEHLNNTMRAQRHDFLNHLQVVHGLLEMDEYDETKKYLEEVYKDIQKTNKILKTSKPAINALLQAKLNDCERKGIKLKLDVRSRLNKLMMPDWELCRVIGNLIDNAKESLIKGSACEGQIIFNIYEDLQFYHFSVSDNGCGVPNENKSNIFEAGFSTKTSPNCGMGLYISRSIMDSYGGNISFITDESYTIFTGVIPKNIDSQALNKVNDIWAALKY